MEPFPSPTTITPPAPRRLTLDELTAVALGKRTEEMSLTHLYFLVHGRIRRRTFWLHGVLSLLLIATLGNALLDIAGLASDLSGKLVNVVLAWPYIAISAKRLHDFNRPAWWMLVNLIPGVGSLFMLLANGCMRGRRGPNRFGPDPCALADRDALSALTALNTAH